MCIRDRVNKDREVRILGAKEQYNAYALGINQTGELIVRKEDGTEEAVYAGEVSVRGVYAVSYTHLWSIIIRQRWEH